MASFNSVVLMGNMTRDPETRQVGSDSIVCSFGLAMNRKFKGADGEDREEVAFVDCSAWNKLGEIIQKYCQKGKLMLIEGRLKYDQWEDAQGGGKRSKLSVVVESMQMLGDPGGGEPRQQTQRHTRAPASNQAAQGRANHQQQQRQQPAPNQRQGTQRPQTGSNPQQRPQTRQNANGPAVKGAGGYDPDADLRFREDDIPF